MPSNLTSAQVLPGFYGFVDYNAQGSGQAPTRRALLIAYPTSAAQAALNRPFLPASQQEANDMCGRGSDAARAFADAASQPEAQGAEVWVAITAAPSGGTASTYAITIVIPGTNPSKSGALQLWIASRRVAAVGFTTSDTVTTIAAAVAAAITANLDLPFLSAVPAVGVVTLTYIHKGLVGEDLPIRCNISPNGSGVNASLGQALFAVAAVGPGSVRVSSGSLSVSTALSGGESAAQVADAVVASWNADSYPMTAAIGSTSATVNFYMVNDKDVRRMSATVITSTGTTVNLGSGATSGAGSPTSLSYNGTQGVGAPTLSSLLTNLAALDPYRSWAMPFTDTATVGAVATYIEASSDGSISGQKQQHLTLCSPLAASVAGAIAPAVSPNLTTSAPHYAMLWAQDAAVQGFGVSARIAAARAALWIDTPQANWNGFQIKGNESSPVLQPSAKPSPLAQNAALFTYALAPVVTGPSGNMEVVKGRTTSLANDRRLWAWSTEAQCAFHAVDLAGYYRELFSGGSIVRYSDPKAPGIFDAESIKVATQNRMKVWEEAGNYDGAELLGPAVQVSIDANNPFRFNVSFAESPVLDLDQISFVGHVTSPSI